MTCQPKEEKQRAIDAAQKRLQQMGVRHFLRSGGTHIIVESPDGDRIDLWPTTGKWMRRGQDMSYGLNVFWKAIGDWGASDGA